jgi:hypothetical protein
MLPSWLNRDCVIGAYEAIACPAVVALRNRVCKRLLLKRVQNGLFFDWATKILKNVGLRPQGRPCCSAHFALLIAKTLLTETFIENTSDRGAGGWAAPHTEMDKRGYGFSSRFNRTEEVPSVIGTALLEGPLTSSLAG